MQTGMGKNSVSTKEKELKVSLKSLLKMREMKDFFQNRSIARPFGRQSRFFILKTVQADYVDYNKKIG